LAHGTLYTTVWAVQYECLQQLASSTLKVLYCTYWISRVVFAGCTIPWADHFFSSMLCPRPNQYIYICTP
jgi:hypothetical protein